MSKLSFRARALDASKPMPIYLAEELPDLPDYSAINRAVPQMPSGMEKEEESEHHLQRAISGTGLIIPTPEVCEVTDLAFYERCYPPDYKMPKQHIHMQPLWEEQEAPEYDIDSEDERWLRQQRHVELTEWKFEQMMDKLEKSSGQTVVTLNEAKLLLERHDDLVTAVYDYWLNKRLNTQHPLILSVKTESRPGQSSNNPYLAFRRRTEKMQTRKNRKNDESSYEKMLKLRRDLARALTLLELVARRENAKRELVKLTATLAERRYAAGDFSNQLLPDPPPRPQFTSVPIAASSFRAYSAPHYPPRAPPTPVDIPRQREKRSYKRTLKKRLPAVGSVLGVRESTVGAGAGTSSEEESSRTEAPPVDDGPFAFRRKPGCYYEMPTSTLCGDPLDPDKATKDALYDHELDDRNRFTLTSLTAPYPRCIGFARRRMARGGRVVLDRVRTPLDDLWPRLPFNFPASSDYCRERDEEVELETKAHRTPKEMTRDYHTSGRHPWRHAFRRHLAARPALWVAPDPDPDPDRVKPDPETKQDVISVKSDSKLSDSKPVIGDTVRTIECGVREGLRRVVRKRAWSGCSDGSYDSDESLQPAEREFEKFIDEVNKKWLHFRPKTPPPSPPSPTPPDDDHHPIALDTPLSVELHSHPSQGLDPFTTSEFTLGSLYDVAADRDASGLDAGGDDLLPENFTGLTEDQVESILSETDLKALASVDLARDDKRLPELLELVSDERDPFLWRGQGADGRAGPGSRKRKADAFGCTTVQVSPLASETMYLETVREPPKVIETPKVKEEKVEAAQPVPTSKIIVEEVNEVPQVKVERRRKEESVEEVQLAHGVQLKTVQTKHSPLKKHIITSSAHRRPSDITLVTHDSPQPQIVTVAVSDSLKVRLQNHLLSTQSGVLVQNGPFPPVAVAVPVQQARESGVSGVSVSGATMSPRRVSTPLVHLAPAALAHNKLTIHHAHAPPASAHLQHAPTHTPLVVAQSHTIHHVAPNKLKVLHAHPLTQTQRTQLLAQNRSIAQLPAVVSLSPLGDGKAANTALLKAAPGGVAQFFEIKSGQLGKGPHLVNVVRQPQPGKTTVSRLELGDKKRQVVALDGAALKGAVARPHRVSLSLDTRQLVRASLPAPAPAAHVRHQIQLKNRTLQVTTPIQRAASEASSSIACVPASKSASIPSSVVANLLQKGVALPKVTTPIQRAASEASSSIACVPASKSASIPSSVVANLLQKGVALPKGGPKVSLSAAPALAANVQAIAFAAHPLKRHQRLLPDQRHPPPSEIAEAGSTAAGTSTPAAPLEALGEAETSSGAVRRRPPDALPMEVT